MNYCSNPLELRPNLRISTYDFDAYGIELPQTSTSQAKPQANSEETNLRYSGEFFDKDLNQQYLRARYYNQNNGQFNRLDPYSGNLSDPQSLHKYAYCAANPVNLIDPSGNFFSLEETTMTTIIIGELQKMATAAIFGGIFGAYNGYKNYLKDDNPDKSFWEHVGGGFIDGAMSGMAFYLLFGALAEFPLVAMWATGIINSAFITAIIYDDSLSIYEKVAFISATIWASFLYAEAMGTKLLNKSMQNYRGPTSSGRSSSSGNTTSFEEGLSTGGKPTTPKSSSNSARSGVNENNSATRNSGATKSKVYNPLTKKGPLGSPNDPGSIASTFRSGTYTKTVAGENMTLYRVTSKGGNPTGSYWTRTKPNGPVQSIIDSALDQKWGNSATQVHQMTLPKGTTFFEGVAAQQRGLVGGGNQIYIPKVKPSWIAK